MRYVHDGGTGRPTGQCCVGLDRGDGHNPECVKAQAEDKAERFYAALDWFHEEAAKCRPRAEARRSAALVRPR